jgi:protein-disulfide isomerase
MRKCVLRAAFLVILGTLAQAQNAPASSVPIALLNGVPIYESDLAASLGQLFQLQKQAYDIKKTALDGVIERKLLSAEAGKAGLSVEELLAREVDLKVTDPTDGEIEAFYLAQPDRQQHPFQDAKPAMRAALRRAHTEQLRLEYVRKLRENAHVQVMLAGPRLEITYDPHRLKGSAAAPVRIVEFSDFECPYCRAEEQTVKDVLAKYGDRVALAYRDFPLTNIHPKAQLAAEASRCAAEQDKYWEYHDRLFANPGLESKDLKAHATALGLDTGKFNTCLDDRKEKAAVDKDAEDGRAAGVTGTPIFFINGSPLLGAQPIAEFEKIIDEELAHAASHP